MRLCRACLAALLLAFGLVLACTNAHAASLDDALAKFTTDDFSDTNDGIGDVAASGSPRAEAIIRALQDGHLMFSAERKAVYIQDDDGKLTDPATGQPVAGDPPADLDTVRLNNRLRGTIDAALGALTLMSPDPAKRLDAAEAVFKSRDQSALPTLESAIEKEQDRAHQAGADAGARGDLADQRRHQGRGQARRRRGDPDSAAIRTRSGSLQSLPAGTAAPVVKAAASAAAAIRNRLGIWNTVQNAWYGISLGSVLLLAAIGLAITFGVMGVINMAHGEMVMIGAYVTFVVQDAIRTHNPALFDYSLAIAIPLAFLVAGLIGILIERCIIRFLYGRPLETLLATWGLSLILQQAVRTTFGPNNREVGNPSFMSGAFDLGGITITYNRLWIICFALAVFVALLGLLRFTRFGSGNARGDAKPRHGGVDGHPHQPGRCADFRPGLGHRRHGRRGALADRQCQPQSRPGLHHRQLHGRGVRRRR